jgi:hypothetical protein
MRRTKPDVEEYYNEEKLWEIFAKGRIGTLIVGTKADTNLKLLSGDRVLENSG